MSRSRFALFGSIVGSVSIIGGISLIKVEFPVHIQISRQQTTPPPSPQIELPPIVKRRNETSLGTKGDNDGWGPVDDGWGAVDHGWGPVDDGWGKAITKS